MPRKNGEGKTNLTRRGFLKATGSAVAMAGITTGGLAWAPKNANGANLPASWDETVEVLVVGSGFAGLAAACEAAGAGAKVVVLEKMPTYGGNSIINGGVYAASDCKLHLRQKLNLGEDSVESHLEDTLKGGDRYNFPELVEVLVKGAPEALNWMIEQGGVELREALTRAGGHSAYRTHTVTAGVGRGFTDPLKKMAESKGVQIRLGSEVTGIWRQDQDGPVQGVSVKSGRRTMNIAIGKALILASGGFSRDVKMRMQFNPAVIPEFNTTNQPGATGEIIRFAQAIGADALQLNFIQLYPFAEPETGILDTPAVYPFNGVGYGMIYVSKEGKRFVNELERRDVCSFAQIKLGLKPTYAIFNEAMVLKMGGSTKEVADGIAKGRFIKAASIGELADRIRIPSNALEQTVKAYNQCLKDKKDSEFNKPITASMLPLDEGPFYAVPQWPAVHHTMGGLRINKHAQVIDIRDKVIPRLYAAGEVTGGIHGSNRLGSNAIPDCVVFGRIAGINAAKENA
jgi:urocanate reductase